MFLVNNGITNVVVRDAKFPCHSRHPRLRSTGCSPSDPAPVYSALELATVNPADWQQLRSQLKQHQHKRVQQRYDLTVCDRALFGIGLYGGCRVSETCSMLTTDAYDAAGVRMKITLPKASTKGKQETRQIPVNAVLKGYLEMYRTGAGKHHLFPGRQGRGHINPKSVQSFAGNNGRHFSIERSNRASQVPQLAF